MSLLSDLAARRLRSLEPPSGSLAPDSAAPHDWDSFDRYSFEVDQHEWLAVQFEDLTSELEVVSPSQWAETTRYLPAQLTPMPGPFRWDVTPYLREIVDCIGLESPIREVSLMKGVQMAATVGILENGIGYMIEHVKTAPCMFVTADLEVAKLRMDTNIKPMIEASGLTHLIKSDDALSKRKAGATDKKVSWFGGGYLLPFGANSAAKMRSFSILALFRDEIDAWADRVGKDGDPMKLTEARTDAYELTRKVVDVSTPLIKGQSKIEKRFRRGRPALLLRPLRRVRARPDPSVAQDQRDDRGGDRHHLGARRRQAGPRLGALPVRGLRPPPRRRRQGQAPEPRARGRVATHGQAQEPHPPQLPHL